MSLVRTRDDVENPTSTRPETTGIRARPGERDITGCRLRAADILLVHTKRSLWGWIIRFGTRCYWNHALMVCSDIDTEQDPGGALVIDAKTDGRIVVNRVGEYLDRSDKYDVAVKRLEADWFQDSNRVSQFDFRGRICNVAIGEVDSRVRARLMELFDQTLRQLTVIFRFIRRKLKGVHTPPSLPWSIRPVHLKGFTCGGFVQWCYYKGVAQAQADGDAGRFRLKGIVFNPRVRREPTPFELLTTTPADLANCRRLSWKYVIKDGVLREVSSSDDVRLLTMPAQPI